MALEPAAAELPVSFLFAACAWLRHDAAAVRARRMRNAAAYKEFFTRYAVYEDIMEQPRSGARAC